MGSLSECARGRKRCGDGVKPESGKKRVAVGWRSDGGGAGLGGEGSRGGKGLPALIDASSWIESAIPSPYAARGVAADVGVDCPAAKWGAVGTRNRACWDQQLSWVP